MSLWLLQLDPNEAGPRVDNINGALVEAVDLATAKTTADGLDGRLPGGYFAQATGTEIQSDTMTTSYQGGLLRDVLLDNGVA